MNQIVIFPILLLLLLNTLLKIKIKKIAVVVEAKSGFSRFFPKLSANTPLSSLQIKSCSWHTSCLLFPSILHSKMGGMKRGAVNIPAVFPRSTPANKGLIHA